ncbi:MAG: hypothetical protein ACXADY_16880 [Candidatus Hodarchaeales archaeon]
MVKGRGSLKRFLLTIIERFPDYIASYPPEDQSFLIDFYNVLQYSEVDRYENRMLFSKCIEAYIKKYYLMHERYYELPYLWFTIDYLNIANRILSTGSFHKDRFYLYLVKHLRGDSKIQGVFDLVKDTTPLIDLKWEILQYSCNKFIVPLTQDQLLILEAVYSLIPKAGLKNLTQQRIKTSFAKRIKHEQKERRKKRRKSQELRKLFTLLNARWVIRPYLSAFGLDWLHFHFQLSESEKISEILGFKNDDNTTLNSSVIYRELSFNNYLGILFLPIKMLKPMELYLKKCENQRKIKIVDASRILDIQVSRSLTLYEKGKGWRCINSKERKNLTQNLKNKEEINQNSHKLFYISPRFYTFWNYKQDKEHDNTSRFIKLYCKMLPHFNFNDLKSKDPSERKSFRFSEEDLKLLSYLHNEQSVIQIDFDPIRLMRDFSLNEFWIGPIVDIPENNLLDFVGYLPDSHMITTKTNTYIWTRLTSEIVQWLRNDLEWSVTPIIEQYSGKLMQYNWFDQKSNEWIPPKLLTDI